LNEAGLVCLSYPREKKSSVSAGKSVELPDDHVMPVGLPNMYSQIKVINRQTGQQVNGHDEQGEICVKSPQLFIGYLNHPELQDKFDSDGFFHTGDLGYYDSLGVVYFIESIANLINFWMYEVAPSILESRLLGSNNILDAAVVGIADKENGQVPRAFVVLRPGFEETEENVTNLMESRLQDHERIRGGLFFIQAIPRDENWKVRRDVLVDFKPRTTEEINQDDAAREDQSAEAEMQREVALELAKSPKLAKKAVQELDKQPNGSFMAVGPQLQAPSPRTVRASLAKSAQMTACSAAAAAAQEPQDRKQQMKPIPEDNAASSNSRRLEVAASLGSSSADTSAASTSFAPGLSSRRRSIEGGHRKTSRYLIGGGSGSRGSSRRSSVVDQMKEAATPAGSASTSAPKKKPFKYWMQLSWDPESLQELLMGHPAVEDCTVQAFNIDGIGSLPRAYVVMKVGYSASAEELLQYLDSRTLSEADKLRGGIVFVDKLAKDPSGKLFISLDKYNKDAEGMDYEFIRGQPKVKTATSVD